MRKDGELESGCSRGCHLPRPLGAEPLHVAQGGSQRPGRRKRKVAACQALNLAGKLNPGGEKLLSASPGDKALDGEAHIGKGDRSCFHRNLESGPGGAQKREGGQAPVGNCR